MKNILLILIGVLFNAFAQIFLRKGMLIIGEVSILNNFFRLFPQIITNIYFLLSILCYGLSFIFWTIILSRVEVSFANAFLSISYVIIAIVGYYLFNENITFIRVIGILFVCVGVYLVSRS